MILNTFLDTFLIGARSAWLARGRGFAVFSGVLLSTMVFSSVIAYSSGLGQVAMQESIKDVVYDAFIQFKNEPGYKPSTRTNTASEFQSICDTIAEKSEFEQCGLMFANTGFYPDKYDDDWQAAEFSKGILGVVNEVGSPQTTVSNHLMFLSHSATYGPIGNHYSDKVIDGEWFSNAFSKTSKQIVLSNEAANKLNLDPGQTVDVAYTYTSNIQEIGTLTQNDCVPITNGATANIDYFAWTEDAEFEACYQTIRIDNVLIIGIYELPQMDGIDGRDINASERNLLTTASLDSTQIDQLMRNDYAVLALKIDRSHIPSNSINAVKAWLIDLEENITGTPSSPVNYGTLEITYRDNISLLLSGLTWFVALIQIFDYVLMIPVILLSLAVLLYGLNLALEQRREEIAIHRLYGGTSRALLGLILTEVFVISIVAWGLGYYLGIKSAPYILDSVGFMEFGGEIDQYDLNTSISLVSSAVICALTVGLAMIVAWIKTKRFLSIEIEEGIQKETHPKRNRILFLINLVLFGCGIGAIIISIITPELNVTYGAFYIFGPFLLWIGGANVLARVSSYGPSIIRILLGKTPILRDVSIGIRSSELNRSMNQLGLIVILTISIATLAVSQGHTGSIVDQKSADAAAGADLQIRLSEPKSEVEVRSLLTKVLNQLDEETTTFELQALTSIYKDQVDIQGQRGSTDIVVVSKDHIQVLNWHSQTLQSGIGLNGIMKLSSRGFTSGADTARTLDLVSQSSETVGNLFSPFNDTENNQSGFDSVTLMYPSSAQDQSTLDVSYIGGHKWIPGMPSSIDPNHVLLIDETTFRQLNGDAAYAAKHWFAELCNERSASCGNFLTELRSQILLEDSVVSATDWQTEYDEVKRNGGLIFGTPGILTLQYVVAVFAALASSVVFLTIILNRRRRELAILQSIGASVSQLSRLVIFEVISVFTFSLLLGGLLGVGIAKIFTGLFSIFGGLFQLLLQSEVIIERELVWPWTQLLAVNGLVFVLVLVALLLTTFRAVRSDLPTALKED